MERFAEFKQTYFDECADLLTQAESRLLALGETGQDPESLNAIFRSVHSIKGGAGAFGFERLIRFSHEFETVLDGVRSGKLALDRSRRDLLLRALDMLADLVRAAREAHDLPPGAEDGLMQALRDWHGGGGAGAGRDSAGPSATVPAMPPADVGLVRWSILFWPGIQLLRFANEPLLLIRELRSLGALDVRCDAAAIPDLAAMDPDDTYLKWRFELLTTAGEAAIREIFEFVDPERLEITPAGVAQSLAPLVSQALPAPPRLVEAGAVPSAPPASEPGVAAGPGPSGQGGAAAAQAASASASIRVDIDRIDRLVNMVGEIVITQAMLAQQVSALPVEHYPQLVQGLEQMAQHTRELQEGVMSIRAQPVRSVFQRMPRLVRELAGDLGKEVRIVTAGETTEVDKTVIEQLADPLTHMVRNAVDHGIETPDVRAAAGKPREGTIMLSAEHRSGRIVIEMTDDGKGIDRERVRRKAAERGLIGAEDVLTDEEIENLIFQPGFSTAETISNVSGRGVGMDVVKRNIQALGGRVHVVSTPGKGSKFTLSLPLTLAVLDGMIVTVGPERYVIPLTSIIESLRPRRKDLSHLVGRGDVLAIRGEYVPLVYVHDMFGVPDGVGDPTVGLVVLVEIEGGEKIGLVVDEMLGQQQVVIKSLESNYQQIDGISAATILGDGRVALILDVVGLRQMSARRGRRHMAAE